MEEATDAFEPRAEKMILEMLQRELPEIERGDFVIVHDAGAHGRAMGFNYNAKLRAGELLIREDGKVVEIRRRETVDDYFATLDFARLGSFKA